jgi:PAS domain S-box-containing protein
MASTQQLFLDIAATLYEAKNFYDIGKIIITILQKLANNQLIGGKIGIYDKEIDEYKIYYNSDNYDKDEKPNEEIQRIIKTPCKFSEIKYFSRIVADTKNKLIIQDNYSETSLKIHSAQKNAEPHAMMWLPLVYKDDFLGIISLGSRPVNSFSDEIVEIVEGIAKLTSIKVNELFTAKILIKSEERLVEKEKRLRNIIENTPAGYFFIDAEGNYANVNQSWLEMYGYSTKDEIIGKPYYTTQVKRDLKSSGDLLNKFFEINQKETGEFSRLNKNGSIGYNNYSISSVEKDGKILGIDGFLIDITENKLAEKALLENERLNAIAEFALGAAHNFNNALQVILGNIELALLEPEISKEINDYLVDIKTSTCDAAFRVRQLQHYASKEKKEDDIAASNLNVLLDSTIEQLKPQWKEESEKNGLIISIQKKYGDTKTVNVNPVQIQTALYNLIKNALEAMPKGGEITLETGNIDKGVFVRITDTGIGMDEETEKRIFQPFYTTKGFELGKGLGMSSTYAIIRDHGGEIYVKESILGKGATIELVLPCTIEKIENLIEIPINKEIDHKISAKVLWVDDEKNIRDIGKIMLQRLGHKADVADSGAEALKLLEHNTYDLIITDLGMPNMNGWQLAEIIKEKYKGTKVAVVTGWGTDEAKEKMEKYGVCHILGKPIEKKQLGNLVMEAMQFKKNKSIL